MTFVVAPDPNALGNGDLAVRSPKGRAVVLIYAQSNEAETRQMAAVVAGALNAAYAPSHTDLMVAPEDIP